MPRDRIPLSCKKVSNQARKSRVADVMARVGERWREAANALVLAARSWLEEAHALTDTLVDGVVVANIEVQEWLIAARDHAPVSAIKRALLRDVEGPRKRSA